jgi:hypothetical protein
MRAMTDRERAALKVQQEREARQRERRNIYLAAYRARKRAERVSQVLLTPGKVLG